MFKLSLQQIQKIDLQHNDASELVGRRRRGLNSKKKKKTLAGGAEGGERRLNRQAFPAAPSLSARE